MARNERDPLKKLASALRAARSTSNASSPKTERRACKPCSSPVPSTTSSSSSSSTSSATSYSPPSSLRSRRQSTSALCNYLYSCSTTLDSPPYLQTYLSSHPMHTSYGGFRTRHSPPASSSSMASPSATRAASAAAHAASRRESFSSDVMACPREQPPSSPRRRVSFGDSIVYAFDKTAAVTSRSGSIVNLSCGIAVSTLKDSCYITTD